MHLSGIQEITEQVLLNCLNTEHSLCFDLFLLEHSSEQ